MSAKEVMAKRGEWEGAAQESKSERSTPLARFMGDKVLREGGR